MNKRFLRFLSRYDYALPPGLIANKPPSPRDSAKLLVYKKKENQTRYARFFDLPAYAPKNAVFVFNKTKVLPARLSLQKETGGGFRALYVGSENGFLRVLSDRRLIAGARVRLKKQERISFIVAKKDGKYYLLKPSFSLGKLYGILERYGETPIPPYIRHTDLSERELKKAYQAVFAEKEGSVAAPTASLHFTERLLKRLKKSGAAVEFVTLHVGLGTFAPLEYEHFKYRKLHREHYEISRRTAEFLNKAKREHRPIIAVGTTVVRTLESASENGGALKTLSGETRLFIRKGYRFKFIDGIVTNFHVPRSSLLMLIAALVGKEKLLELYRKAIKNKFRFFSFGDGMFIY